MSVVQILILILVHYTQVMVFKLPTSLTIRLQGKTTQKGFCSVLLHKAALSQFFLAAFVYNLPLRLKCGLEEHHLKSTKQKFRYSMATACTEVGCVTLVVILPSRA